MAPMTRAMSPGGVPGENVARYYRRRAEGGVGLIITEGTFIPHPSAGHDENAPRIYGDDALAGWRRVIEQVHDAGARLFLQLWHVGLVRKPRVDGVGLLYDNGPGSDDRFSPSPVNRRAAGFPKNIQQGHIQGAGQRRRSVDGRIERRRLAEPLFF
jgi:2,4-dienoyl-CoA reductase-like NADH-dependent reductase (Old Yellow Enzyme family)